MDANQKLGAIIRIVRIQSGISVKDFAQLCGLSAGYISLLESNGGRNPVTGRPIDIRDDTFAKIAGVLGMTSYSLKSVVGY